jgi:hypothetical protein
VTRDRPPLLPAALARVGTGAAFARVVQEDPMPPRKRKSDPADFTPLDAAAGDAGIPERDVARYLEVEADHGTGLLPAQVWADALGHDAPDPAAFLRVGIPPGQPVTWLLYATVHVPSHPGKSGQ